MKLVIAAALATVTGAASAACWAPSAGAADAPADANQPCDSLIEQARHLPDSAWIAGAKVLQPALTINIPPGAKPSGGVQAAIANLSEVKKALEDETGSWTIFVDRLPDTDVYVASEYQGTLHCQQSVFLSAPQGASPKVIDPPPGWGEGDVCWTRSADPGVAFGKPAFVEHGAVSQVDDDESIKITPWTGAGWGPACRFGLHFKPVYKRTTRHCQDRSICAAADAIAPPVVAAYNRWPDEARATGTFWYGVKPSDAALKTVARLADPKALSNPTDFPISGSQDDLGLSYSGFALFPLVLNGHSYVAAIGHTGVGWRESKDTVLAIYTQTGDRLTRIADYMFSRSIGGLQSASLEK